MKHRILLADDHEVVRTGLRRVLEGMGSVELAGEASDGREAVRLAEQLKPDLVIMDISMPELNGVEATRQIVALSPQIKVIILSMHPDRQYVSEALRAGACGYVLKNVATRELATAVTAALSGKTFLSPKIQEVVVQHFVRGEPGSSSAQPAGQTRAATLTPREREVLQLLAEGKSNKEIAARLFVSVKTVEAHRAQIMDKLDIRTVAELTKYAIRQGLTTLES